ncbi:MAG TPA: hypothetical protein P5299_01040 [Candidatus Woesebacteria bacterium]|nr:hypothetical protein [Candidatus Woesebacteria bacterium]
MKKLIQKHCLLIILLFSLPAWVNLLRPVYWNMHDDMQLIRQLEFEKCLNDGQIPCRWTPDLGYGYGYPLFNFYPPLPYLVGQFYRFLGFSFINTVKLTAITQIILATLAMYYLAKVFFPPLSTILVTLLYTYAPYHAVNIYIRGAMNEAWASVFFPLCFLFSYRLIKTPKTNNLIFLALAYAGLLLSHNPMALTFFPFLLAWIIFWLIIFKKYQKIKIYLNFVYAGLLSLGLTAFFTLPVIFESRLVQVETMFRDYFHYSVHFVSLFQLFISNFWGDGPSVWGTGDQMSFMIGLLHWLIPLLTLVIIIFLAFTKKLEWKKYRLFFLLLLLALGATFMTHGRSTFIWQSIHVIQKMQFPWRFLNQAAFFFSLSSGFFLLLFKNKKRELVSFFTLLVLIILINAHHFRFVTAGPITDEQKFSGQAWTNQITSGIYDYLPKTAGRAATAPANFPIDMVNPPQSQYELNGVKHGTDWFLFNIKLNYQTELTLAQLAFPNFEIKDNGRPINYLIEKDLGRMVISLPRGEHQIYVKLRNTPIRHLANFISLLSWIGLLAYFSQNLWKKST